MKFQLFFSWRSTCFWYTNTMFKLFMIPLAVWAVIQWIKLLIDLKIKKKLSYRSIWSAWWFPSVHSGIAASITTLMLLLYGRESAEFAIAFSFSFLFWYDAANVRYEAGQHATFLNQITQELKELNAFIFHEQDLDRGMLLKERLWHTVTEVIWGIIFGTVLTWLFFTSFPTLISL